MPIVVQQTLSGTVNFTVTRDDICTLALQYLGVIAEGETPNAYQMGVVTKILNMLVKQWQGTADFAPGLKVWSRKRGDLILDSTKSSYLLGPTGDRWAANLNRTTTAAAYLAGATVIVVASVAGMLNGDQFGVVLQSGSIFWTTVSSISGNNVTVAAGLPSPALSGAIVYDYTSKQIQPLQIVACTLKDNQGNTVYALDKVTVETMEAQPSLTNSATLADPLQYYYERQSGNGVLYLNTYPSDLSKFLHFVFLSPIQDFNAATDNPDYPQNWFLPLSQGLAINSGPIFNKPISQDLKDLFQASITIARNQDPDTSDLYFQPGADDSISYGGPL